jgi:hypothetical protein
MRSAITVSTFQKPVGAVMVGILGRVREGLFMGLLAVYTSVCGSFFRRFSPLRVWAAENGMGLSGTSK